MKHKDAAQKSDKELVTMLGEERAKLSQAVLEMRTKQVSNVKQISAHRKLVARILTIQRERDLTQLEESNG